MRVLVSTCDKYAHLVPGFALCFNKYWGADQEVTVLGYNMPYTLPDNFKFVSLAQQELRPFTYHLRPYIEQVKEEYFTFIMEDHWLYRHVNKVALNELAYRVQHEAQKADLEGVLRHHGILPCTLAPDLVQADQNSWARTALQPSIWRKSYILKLLDAKGIDPWEFEAQANLRFDGALIVGYNYPVYCKPDSNGVYHQGRPFLPSLNEYATEDLRALRAAGYSRIAYGDLGYYPCVPVI